MNRAMQGCLGFAVMMAAMCISGEAFAATIASPFGASAVDARIGQEAGALPNSQPMVIWRRKSDGACQITNFGTATGFFPGLNQNMIFQGGSGGDTIVVQAAVENIACGATTFVLGPVGGNGFQLQISGLNGSDVVLGGFPTTLAWYRQRGWL